MESETFFLTAAVVLPSLTVLAQLERGRQSFWKRFDRETEQMAPATRRIIVTEIAKEEQRVFA